MFLDVLPVEPFTQRETVEEIGTESGGANNQVSKVAPTTFIIGFLVIVAAIVIANVTRVINKELKNA